MDGSHNDSSSSGPRRVGWALAKTRVAAIAWFVLAMGFLLSLPILLDASIWVPFAVVAAALLLAWPVAALLRWGLRRPQRPLMPLWRRTAVALTLLLGILLAAPVYFFVFVAALRPAALPQAVLTNGTKTVTFQGMMHVGSEGFYKAVIYDLERALVDGATIYYEGVLPDKVGDAWLAEYIPGGDNLAQTYQTLASSCGLVFQSGYFELLQADMKARPERHVAADVSSLQMKQEYERLAASDPAFAASMAARKLPTDAGGAAAEADPVARFLAWQKNGTEGQKSLAGVVCRGLMTLSQDHSAPRPSGDALDRVILDYRNRALVDRIVSDERQKIFITYGAAHLPGVVKMLQAKDATWRVASVKWMRTIEPPQKVEGRLSLMP